MGLSFDHLRRFVVRPVLQDLGLHSQAAENLVLGTIAVESGGRYLHQLGRGPALGVCQMEPSTHDDIWENYLRFHPTVASMVLQTAGVVSHNATFLIYNLRYAAAMCRMHYYRVKERLPAADDLEGLARYHKRYYNTALGATDSSDFLDAYAALVDSEKAA